MNGTTGKAPWHLWVIGVLTLLWNSIGIMSYLATRMDKLESLGMTADQIAYFDSYPLWANAFWALGVWGAFAGSILLLLRSRWAVTSLIVAIAGLVGTSLYQHVLTQTPESLQNPVLAVSIWVITALMLWYAVKMRSAGVLR
ncbi:hypothetical protein GRI43_07165 [Altererythrobacter luteolus]|uniref:Sugar transporter n=1 Tax=Pontixanthobacter luteolus TaxID=295089 RepID=A0A6I4UZZ1_9SPHN|nr:hypothetical protein [Pontixanthobacter luteolus]MXP47168.1 hypothetical protein [Pontixanthobacter luteolus]